MQARVQARARQAAEEAELKRKLDSVARHFRANGVELDPASLEAVLAVCDGDVQAAIDFLQLQGEPPADFVDVRNVGTGAGGVPPDYMRLPDVASLPALPALPPSATPGLAGLLRAFTESDTTLREHVALQQSESTRYRAVLQLCVQRGIDLPAPTKARVLAACWARRDFDFSEMLLSGQCQGILDVHEGRADIFGLVDIVRALRLLDTARVVRVRARRLAQLESQPGTKPQTLARLRAEIEELQRDLVPGSLSGALAKRVRAIVARIPASKLEFFALQLPAEPWKELCDMLHIHPTKGTSVSWFLPRCFGDAAPADSIVSTCANITPDNVEEIVTLHQPPYSFLRLKCPNLPAACRSVVARYTALDQCLWWYEDLHCDDFDAILLERLRAGERPTLPYGKLMERLMVLRATSAHGELFTTLLGLAEQRLQGMRLSLPPPVVVLGDASYSMDVAIRVSVIMASVLAVLAQAELKFFNTVSFAPPSVPHTAAGVLEVASTTRADGPTAPACALWEYYTQRRPVNTFIVVTDERENTKSQDTYFPMLFRRYLCEVHPARLVLVSFLEPNAKGQMAAALKALGINPVQFSLDGRRPDLTRLDGLLGLLSTSTESFEAEVDGLMASSAVLAAAAAKATPAVAPALTTAVAPAIDPAVAPAPAAIGPAPAAAPLAPAPGIAPGIAPAPEVLAASPAVAGAVDPTS